MKKIVISILLIVLMVLIVSSGATTLFTGNLSNFKTTINPPEISFVPVNVSIQPLNSLETFDTGTISPPETEIHIANINVSKADISSNITSIEKMSFSNLLCHIRIYNSTLTLLNVTLNPLLDEHAYITKPLQGDWNVSVRYIGTTSIVYIPAPISFGITINITDTIPICKQYFGAVYQINETYYPLQNTTITVNGLHCITDNHGYCILNLYDHASYTVSASHPNYNTSVSKSFIACYDGYNTTGYPIILKFQES